MHLRRLHLLPGFLFLLVMLTFAATYVIAVLNEHVEPGFPYISDTGTEPPESCIFAQFINIAAFLLMCCVYVRYLQVEEVARSSIGLLPRWVNRTAAVFGYLACFGLDIVANFQETNVLIVHMIGAFICFFFGTIFFIFETYISRKLMPHVTSSFSFLVRVLASILCIVLCIMTVVPGGLAWLEFDGEDKTKWRPEDAGWTMHLISTISEWALVVCFCTFIASFSGEFYGIELQGPFMKLPQSKSFQTV